MYQLDSVPFPNHLLDGDLCKISLISIFYLFFWLSIITLSYTFILLILQLQTQQLMTSQIRSHIEYLTHSYNIFVLILYAKLMRNVSALAGFDTI